jgi:integrase
VSRWFNENYLVKTGIKNDSKTEKVFHSFRHTFANACKISGVEEYKAREILGHEVSSKSITYGRYGKKYPIDILFTDVIQKINLPDVSMS